MSEAFLIQYVGFAVKPQVREYTFSVREGGEQRNFTLTIENQAFLCHRVRYQDAPDICSARLRQELLNSAERSPDTHFSISDTELDAYRESHLPKARRNLWSPRPPEDY